MCDTTDQETGLCLKFNKRIVTWVNAALVQLSYLKVQGEISVGEKKPTTTIKKLEWLMIVLHLQHFWHDRCCAFRSAASCFSCQFSFMRYWIFSHFSSSNDSCFSFSLGLIFTLISSCPKEKEKQNKTIFILSPYAKFCVKFCSSSLRIAVKAHSCTLLVGHFLVCNLWQGSLWGLSCEG